MGQSTEQADKTPKDLDIDFENFAVEPERATGIRGTIVALKASNWPELWKLLLNELGRDESPENESSPKLPGISADSVARVYRIESEGHPAFGLSLVLQGAELKVFRNDESLVELTYLPKEDEYAVFFVNEARFAELTELMTGLETDIKAARAQKSARGNTWKERFNKG